MVNILKFSNLVTSGKSFIDFGLQPVSNRFIASKDPIEVPHYPIELCICEETGVIHLAKPFPVEELKPQYDWLTCFEPEDHLDDLVETLIKLPNLSKDSIFGAYSFKDDSTLERLKKKGYLNTWRIDPVKDLGVDDSNANVETYQAVFNEATAAEIKKSNGAADVVIVRHVVEHAYNLAEFIKGIINLAKEDGYIVWELPDCERPIAQGDCTTVWEEHVYYFTSFTFKQILSLAGLEVIHFESVPYPLENSIIAITKLSKGSSLSFKPHSEQLNIEIERAQNFAKAIEQRRIKIREKLESLKQESKTIALFGAGHLSIAFLSLMGVTDLIDYIIDDNDNKKGLKMPIGNLEIIGSDVLYEKNISLCLLSLNPQNQPKVISKHQAYIENGGVFASIFPGSHAYMEDVL